MEHLRGRRGSACEQGRPHHSSPPAPFRLECGLLSPESILRLQRLAGNSAVCALIQDSRSQGLERSSDLRPLAVQRYSGIAKQARMRTLQARIDALTAWGADPGERLKNMAAPALGALASAGVPLPTVEFGPAGGGLAGKFLPKPWKIVMEQSATYQSAVASLDQKQDLASELVHEARHADQYYLAARMIYGLPIRTRTPAQKTLLAGLPDPVKVAARRHSLSAPTIFGKAKYQAALNKVGGLLADIATIGAREKAVADTAGALQRYFTELDDAQAEAILLEHWRDLAHETHWRQWHQAKVAEGDQLRQDREDALFDYAVQTEEDAFEMQMRARRGTFDRRARARQIADKNYAPADRKLADLLAQIDRVPPSPPVVPAPAGSGVQPFLQRHGIPEDIEEAGQD